MPVGQDVLAAIRPILAGRGAGEILLERWYHKRVGWNGFERDYRGPWKAAADLTSPWNKIAEAAGLAGIVPYSLRHSSIVRGLREGLPIRLVAALHDTSVEMIERHYSRWITEGLDEFAARAIVPLVAA
jgi:integrase